MPFSHDFKYPSIDISKTYGFEIIIAFPSVKPKYDSLKRRFNGDDLTFYEEPQLQGAYHLEYYLEGMPSPIEAKVTLSPNVWEEQTKTCELTISYIGLEAYRYNSRKNIVNFGKAILSRISGKYKVIWLTENGKIIWENSNEEK